MESAQCAIFTHKFVFTKRTSEALRASEFCYQFVE